MSNIGFVTIGDSRNQFHCDVIFLGSLGVQLPRPQAVEAESFRSRVTASGCGGEPRNVWTRANMETKSPAATHSFLQDVSN